MCKVKSGCSGPNTLRYLTVSCGGYDPENAHPPSLIDVTNTVLFSLCRASCGHLGSPAAVSCPRARHLAAARQRRVRPFVMAPLVCALWWLRIEPSLALGFRGAPLVCTCPSVAVPLVAARTCACPCGGASTSRPCLASSRAQGTSALDLAAVAFSASPAGSKPAVPSARASAVPTTGTAPPHSCALTSDCREGQHADRSSHRA